MTDLERLIAHGEGDQLEFKKKINQLDKIARTLVSLANTKGGIILVGVLDNGLICGIDPEEEKHNLQQASEYYTRPAVKLIFEEIEADNRVVLKAIVPESKQKNHFAKIKENEWRQYVRVKDESVQTGELAQKAAEAAAQAKSLAPTLTKHETLLLLHLQKQPRVTLQQFMHLAHISKQRAARLLMGLMLQGRIQEHDPEQEPYYTLS